MYLDWAATAPPDPAAIDAADACAVRWTANPSSVHTAGLEAAQALDTFRDRVADRLGCAAEQVVFTSGGTESNALVVLSLIARMAGESKGPGDYSVVASAVEHASVYENTRTLARLGFRCTYIPTERSGLLDPQRVADSLQEDTVLLLTIGVSNITGAIQPIEEIAAAAHHRRGRRIMVHTDAVQALGKTDLSPLLSGADSASFSAHKLGGPRGTGVLYLRERRSFTPLFTGGDQEYGIRPGTQNLPGVAGLAAALDRGGDDADAARARAADLMAALIEGVKDLPGVTTVPASRLGAPRDPDFSPYIATLAFPPIPGEVVVRALAERSVFVSTGSACSSRNREKRERVLRGMGVAPEIASSSLRISIGWDTTESDIAGALDALHDVIPSLARVAQLTRGRVPPRATGG